MQTKNETQSVTVDDPYTAVVIGAGPGGLTVALSLAMLGRRVALVEGRAVGGDCTNVGCVPSKTLIHLANTQAADSKQVMRIVQAKRDQLRDMETHDVQHTPNLDYISGWAKFVSPRRVEVTRLDGSRLELRAANVVIATGSRPRELEIQGLPRERVLTNETVFDIEQAPQHLAIIGSGAIAMELAFAFRNLGSRVTVISADPRVMAQGAQAVSDALHERLGTSQIEICLDATPVGYDERSMTLTIQRGRTTAAITNVDKVLLAVGRIRNIDTLQLERAGVAYDLDTGIKVDHAGETNVSGVFAVGDVTPDSRWTHSAGKQARRVVQRIVLPWVPQWAKPPLYPDTTFSQPEVANVGLAPADIAKRYHPGLVKALRAELPKTDKGYAEGLDHGFIQVYVLRLSGRILGATIVGLRASDMISFWTLAISEHISLYRLYRLAYPYPTHSGATQRIADTFVRDTLTQLVSELRDVARAGVATVWGRMVGRAFGQIDEPEPYAGGQIWASTSVGS